MALCCLLGPRCPPPFSPPPQQGLFCEAGRHLWLLCCSFQLCCHDRQGAGSLGNALLLPGGSGCYWGEEGGGPFQPVGQRGQFAP